MQRWQHAIFSAPHIAGKRTKQKLEHVSTEQILEYRTFRVHVKSQPRHANMTV